MLRNRKPSTPSRSEKKNRHRFQTLSTSILPNNEVKLISWQAGSVWKQWRFYFSEPQRPRLDTVASYEELDEGDGGGSDRGGEEG